MGIQAFDKDGNRIPFAIYDTDYTVNVPDAPITPVNVEVRLGNINSLGVLLDVHDRQTGTLLDKVVTFDELFANPAWVVTNVVYPLSREVPRGHQVGDTLALMGAFRDVHDEVEKLRDERNTTTDTARYDAIPALMRDLERRRDVRKFQVEMAIEAAFGASPSDLFHTFGLR